MHPDLKLQREQIFSGILATDGVIGQVRMPSAPRLDLENELVMADPDPVTVSERDAASYSTVVYVNTVGRAQVGDDEDTARVADHGVVAADLGVVQHDVIIRKPADPSGRPDQGMDLPRQGVKARHGGRSGRRDPPIEDARGGGGSGECGSPHVQDLLA